MITNSLSGRQAHARLLTAIDLPELITSTQEDYEKLAVELATNPERLKTIKEKLQRNRLTTPLFDTRLFTKHIEDAYTQMVCLLYTSPSPRDRQKSRMPSSA